MASGSAPTIGDAAALVPFLAQALLDVNQTALDAIRIVGELEQARNQFQKSLGQ